MAYIAKEDVTAIRNELKATFPKFTFGVKKMHGGSNGVDVTVKAGPTDFSDCFRGDEGYAQINHYHTNMYGDHKNFFDTIHKIIKTAPIKGEGYWKNKGWYDKSDSMTDYFDTAYYISMNVGSWNRPYVQK
tara:strand:- start:187 stop:579 length:393 start_codon:yes stop_codon:yes gene_type:complete